MPRPFRSKVKWEFQKAETPGTITVFGSSMTTGYRMMAALPEDAPPFRWSESMRDIQYEITKHDRECIKQPRRLRVKPAEVA